MQTSPLFVLAWITRKDETPTEMGQGGEVLFVEHPERGWEIPGGHLEANESPEEALHREIKEETGLAGTLLSWNKSYYSKGWVAHVEVDTTTPAAWQVEDKNVRAVKWWNHVPPVKTWTVKEFEDLARHFSA